MKPGWCFLIFRIFLHLFLNFLTRVGFERKEIFRIFLHLYLNFLTRVGFERIWRKFFLFTIFRPVLTRFILKWSLDDVFWFLKFFCIYFWISNSGRVGTGRKEIFFVLYFSACPDPFRLEMKSGWCFLIFKNFLHLCLNFQTRVGFERVGRKFFLFSIFRPVLTRFVLKWSLDDVI